MMQSATPAGRIYAAILLQRSDRIMGDKALKQLLSDRTEVTFIQGCILSTEQVGKLAAKILKGEIVL
jgi:hypothetical protein